MSKPQSLFHRALKKFGGSQELKGARRRRFSRRLGAELLEDRKMLAGDLFINELMADNDATIEDPEEPGAYEDWVELYNRGSSAIDLSGMYLTDDLLDPTQWVFPAGSSIDANSYLLIWTDSDPEQGDRHTSFKLSSGGETIAIYDTDGTTLVDSIEFPAQATDASYGRTPDASATLGTMATPTPGAANSTIVPSNFAPQANAGGPYAGTTANGILLSGSASTDTDGTIATYAWDFDRDGQYDDATGSAVTFSSASEGTFIVGLKVTDDDGATSEDTGTVVVSQVGHVPSAWDPVAIDDLASEFFDDTEVHEVHITFADADWYNTLFTSHDTDAEDPYFVASFVGDGVALDGDIGVRFKGNSSFNGSGVKKSIKLDFNEFDDLTFFGMKKLNLNNNFNDPTMLREKLFYDFASNYVEGVSRAVHTKVYINGAYYGLYTAVEQVDSTFIESHFGEDEDGNLFKGTASDEAVLGDPSADFGSDLTYLGTDPDDYADFYDLKTNETANDYSQLIEMIDVLNNTTAVDLPNAIEPLLDVDDALAGLALNNLFVNLDSYSGAAHNFYVYDRDDTGQITHLLWDANESFGTFTQFVDRRDNPLTLDPFWLPEGTATEEQPRPLAENLWAVDGYSEAYLRDLSEMLREGFDVTTATTRINELADLIRADVTAGPNKQFTTAQFEQNLTSNVSAGRRTVYGLTSFISTRASYLATAVDDYEPCDYVGDLGCDMADIDALYSEAVGAPGPLSDASISQWLTEASSTSNPLKPTSSTTFVLGDANLDGEVNSTDLGVLLNNFGDTSGLGWGAGNLNSDANVNSTDLGLLLNNFGFSSLAVAATAVEAPVFNVDFDSASKSTAGGADEAFPAVSLQPNNVEGGEGALAAEDVSDEGTDTDKEVVADGMADVDEGGEFRRKSSRSQHPRRRAIVADRAFAEIDADEAEDENSPFKRYGHRFRRIGRRF